MDSKVDYTIDIMRKMDLLRDHLLEVYVCYLSVEKRQIRDNPTDMRKLAAKSVDDIGGLKVAFEALMGKLESDFVPVSQLLSI